MISHEHDLSLTIQKLHNVYEELSLLCRISEVFSFLSIDEIALRIANEAINTIGVHTAAVFFPDEKGEKLQTKVSKEDWDDRRLFDKNSRVIWKSIDSKKAAAFCRLAETEHKDFMPELSSLMVCPLIGKVASSCWTAGHTERVTDYSIAIGRVMGLEEEMLEKLKISALLHDIGKIATPKEILNKNGKLTNRRNGSRSSGMPPSAPKYSWN